MNLYELIRPYTKLDPDRWEVIEDALCASLAVEGDLAEVGVYRGGASLGMSLLAPDRTVHLFDTFTGLRQSQVAEPHYPGEFSDTSLDQVKALFSEDAKVEFHEGWFPETVTPELAAKWFAFVHVDGDYYETTKAAIEFFWPRLSVGGSMVFDDFGWVQCPGVRRALNELQPIYGYRIVPVKTREEIMQATICKRKDRGV